ncbi:MAG: hypothetical protein LBN20_04345 [Endomicrobium sp.]|nr:hypothetical protein [Endomicrobium sp.]
MSFYRLFDIIPPSQVSIINNQLIQTGTFMNIDTYLNDPQIRKEPQSLKEVHAIRLMINDEIKDMQPNEIGNYYRNAVIEAQKKFNFKVIANTSEM